MLIPTLSDIAFLKNIGMHNIQEKKVKIMIAENHRIKPFRKSQTCRSTHNQWITGAW